MYLYARLTDINGHFPQKSFILRRIVFLLALSRIVFDLHLFYRAAGPPGWGAPTTQFLCGFAAERRPPPRGRGPPPPARLHFLAGVGGAYPGGGGGGGAAPGAARPKTPQNMETWPLGARRAPKGRLKNKH